MTRCRGSRLALLTLTCVVCLVSILSQPGWAQKDTGSIVGTIRDAAHKFDRWMDITLVQLSLEAKAKA